MDNTESIALFFCITAYLIIIFVVLFWGIKDYFTQKRLTMIQFFRAFKKDQVMYDDGPLFRVNNKGSFFIIIVGAILLFTTFVFFRLREIKLFPDFYILYLVISGFAVALAYKFRNRA